MPTYLSTTIQRALCPNTETDYAGENKKLAQRLHSADWKLQVEIEYTAADTPHQNALVELKLTYLTAKARAALHAAGCPRRGDWIFSRDNHDFDQTRLVKTGHNQRYQVDQD